MTSRIYAVWHGEEYECAGTAAECAAYVGVAPSMIRAWATDLWWANAGPKDRVAMPLRGIGRPRRFPEGDERSIMLRDLAVLRLHRAGMGEDEISERLKVSPLKVKGALMRCENGRYGDV